MSTFLLFVLIGLGMIVAHGLLILTARSLAPVAHRAVSACRRAAGAVRAAMVGGAR